MKFRFDRCVAFVHYCSFNILCLNNPESGIIWDLRGQSHAQCQISEAGFTFTVFLFFKNMDPDSHNLKVSEFYRGYVSTTTKYSKTVYAKII